MGSKCENSSLFPVAIPAYDQWEMAPISEVGSATGGLPATRLPPPPPAAAYASRGHIKPRPSPPDSPAIELQKLDSGQYLGGKILKLLLKLRKPKSNSAGCSGQQTMPSRPATLEAFCDFAGAHVEDVTERYNYDSDEHSGSVASCGASSDRLDRPNSSSNSSSTSACASALSSSRGSSRSGQSFDSTTSSQLPLRSPCSSLLFSGGHLSSSQLMANILISLSHLDEDDDDDDDDAIIPGDDVEDDRPGLGGPRESAWHQPRADVFGQSPRGRLPRHSSKCSCSSCTIDQHLMSPGPSRRFGKLDLSKIDKLR